ncbi:MAG: amidohydrolase [Flavobacteriales bacterium]
MKLTIAAIQTNLHWEDPEANREHFANLLAEANPANLYVLPEMFTTGFTMNAITMAESYENSSTIEWMKRQAAKKRAAIAGSLIIKDKGKFYNRFAFVLPDGLVTFYDKRHLFRMANENDSYAPGKARCVVNWKGFRILLQVCYDLRFPVWSRNVVDEQNRFLYDAVLYVANWPSPRISAWDTLLKARAIENISYVVGVNRIGQDAKGNSYTGHTACIDFMGNLESKAKENQQTVIYTTWDKIELMKFREKFPSWMDADEFSVKV